MTPSLPPSVPVGGTTDRDHMAAVPAPADRLLRLREVEAMVGLGRSTIYRKMADGSFPRPLEIGPATVRWRESELRDWIEALPASTKRRS